MIYFTNKKTIKTLFSNWFKTFFFCNPFLGSPFTLRQIGENRIHPSNYKRKLKFFPDFFFFFGFKCWGNCEFVRKSDERKFFAQRGGALALEKDNTTVVAFIYFWKLIFKNAFFFGFLMDFLKFECSVFFVCLFFVDSIEMFCKNYCLSLVFYGYNCFVLMFDFWHASKYCVRQYMIWCVFDFFFFTFFWWEILFHVTFFCLTFLFFVWFMFNIGFSLEFCVC